MAVANQQNTTFIKKNIRKHSRQSYLVRMVIAFFQWVKKFVFWLQDHLLKPYFP